MKSLFLTSLIVATTSLIITATPASAQNRKNCKITNAGGCVKNGNGWLEFCPAVGDEDIDPTDLSDRACLSIRPINFAEFNSETGERKVVKSSAAMNWMAEGLISTTTFNADCQTDISVPCAVEPTRSLKALRFTVGTQMTTSSRMLIDLFIFSDAGVLSYDSTKYYVEAGSFKFDMRTDKYVFVNEGMDSISMDVEMKTLGGAIRDHNVTSNGKAYIVDEFVYSPNRYTHNTYAPGVGALTRWGESETTKNVRDGIANPVITFALRNLPTTNNGFRFDPYIMIPNIFTNGVEHVAVGGALGAVVMTLIAFLL